MNLILFASTGGTTAKVAQMIRSAFGEAVMVDIKTFDAREVPAVLDWVIAGTPTYGIGDWHYAWSRRIIEIVPVLARARRVALFGLGDARFHGGSFCGGLGRLHDAVTGAGIRVYGQTPAHKYRYSFSPALRDGVFPGFALDFRQSRPLVMAEIESWASGLKGVPG